MQLAPTVCDVATALPVLARRHPRAGYRKCTARLTRAGYRVNRACPHQMSAEIETLVLGQDPSVQVHTDAERRGAGFSPEGASVPDNVELTVRLHSVSGEDVSVMTREFNGAAEALDAIGHALNERRSLTLTRAR